MHLAQRYHIFAEFSLPRGINSLQRHSSQPNLSERTDVSPQNTKYCDLDPSLSMLQNLMCYGTNAICLACVGISVIFRCRSPIPDLKSAEEVIVSWNMSIIRFPPFSPISEEIVCWQQICVLPLLTVIF